jgi:exosome complex component CSL4
LIHCLFGKFTKEMQESEGAALKRSERPVLPGDKIATIEEFVAGENALTNGDFVISKKVGIVSPDMKRRVINVLPVRSEDSKIPKVGDFVIGTVESAQGSIAQVKIEAINDQRSDKSFTGMLLVHEEGRKRSSFSSPVKAGDVIRAQVFSTKNAIFHLTIDAPNCGVIFTVCSNCGEEVVALSKDRVKCTSCGWVEERALSDEFVKYSRSRPPQ